MNQKEGKEEENFFLKNLMINVISFKKVMKAFLSLSCLFSAL